MAESNSQPTRCPCGYFGSSQTLGLCSKCFREREQNRDQITADAARSSGVSMEMRVERESSSSVQEDSQHNNITPRAETDPDSRASETSRVAPPTTADTDAASVAAAADSPPHQRGRKRKADELDDDDCHDGTAEETDGSGGRLGADSDIEDHPPVQKNKKRCFACNCRLDLATREIGKCKCEYIFCALHRLPEQHNCTFDHKGHRRQEARAKMVVLKKHVGTALKRLDSDS